MIHVHAFNGPPPAGTVFACCRPRQEELIVKVAIPRWEETVAPCFDYCATMAIFTVEGQEVVAQMDFPLSSRDPLDRVRLLCDQGVTTIICGGVRDVFEEIISWSLACADE